jgi:hypothetical protein
MDSRSLPSSPYVDPGVQARRTDAVTSVLQRYGRNIMWQYQHNMNWIAFDQDTSALIEQAFITTESFVLLPCESSSVPGADMCVHFDDCKIGGIINIRRSDQAGDSGDSAWCYEADDGSWPEMDYYSSNTLNAFFRSGRSTIVLHTPYGSYRIEHISGSGLRQSSVITGKRRALKRKEDVQLQQFDALSSFVLQTAVPYDEDDDETAPDNFKCPITRAVMVDPVSLADGHTYERQAILNWLRQHNKSPKTGAVLPDTRVTPNHVLRSVIQEDMAARKAARIGVVAGGAT